MHWLNENCVSGPCRHVFQSNTHLPRGWSPPSSSQSSFQVDPTAVALEEEGEEEEEVGLAGELLESMKALKIRSALYQAITLGIVVASALVMWKGLMCITGCSSPVVVVLTGSMEPGFKRGDILFLRMTKDPIRTGEIVVFDIEGRDIPIVHRAITVHERQDNGEVDVLTKGDNNDVNDRALYAKGQLWLQRHHIRGRAVGILPYVGWATIIMTEKPIVKYILIGVMGLLFITSKEKTN